MRPIKVEVILKKDMRRIYIFSEANGSANCYKHTQADGDGTTYTQGQQIAMGTSNVTLYAK